MLTATEQAGPHRGAARGGVTAGFAPRLGGCRRFACLRAQHPLLPEQCVRASQVNRWFQHSKQGAARVGPFQDSRAGCGTSHTVCLFACAPFSAFGAVCE
eukprot:917730-Pyramimonas_sp.AAC.1